MKFCSDCKNLLETSTDGNILQFVCRICHKEYASNPSDTLLKREDLHATESSLYKYETFIKLANKDTMIPLVSKNCENDKCDETILKMITVSDNMQYIYICPKCNHIFITS
jgi:DNA-directed RNA polymerase subunit M/transcription elongation factor TFIIS